MAAADNVSAALMAAVPLLATALLWGATNPFIKRASESTLVASGHAQPWRRWVRLMTNWRFVLPLVLNLSGSAVFYYALQFIDLSVATPVANALTFVVTAVVGQALGEQVIRGSSTWLGMALVVVGTAICVSESSSS